ncbi:MAG: 2-hydroxychromene-2-carboxylate isomerase [Pseudomonadota bacterium]
MAKIEYFYSLLSPFTYLAGLGLEEIAASHDAEIVYRPADILHVFAQTGGTPVPKRHPSRQAYRLQELTRLSRMNGFELNLQPAHWPVDAVPASCAVIAIKNAGGPTGDVSHAFLKACWAEDRDISKPETIAAIAADHGFDVASLSSEIAAAEDEFNANTQSAIEAGVFGAPFYVVGDEKFWGQDRLSHLDWHLSQSG